MSLLTPNLRLVVIDKLPFTMPKHPLAQARHEQVKRRGGDPFLELSLPAAVLRLRQGFGRLIRTADDKGMVCVLDPRLVKKRYGAVFLNSLPKCRVMEYRAWCAERARRKVAATI